ncbi:MAG: peptidylprolyl isomerase [Phycisphaerales bacterium]|nr:peptidylprolyl isomerase [Phycisphaerales bacterium]
MSHRSTQTLLQRLTGILIVGSLLVISTDGTGSVVLHPDPTVQASGVTQDLLQPNRLYNRIGRPIPVVLALRGRADAPEAGFDLLLIDTDGTVLDSANGGTPGEFDLLTALPAILNLQRTARVQVVADGMATGTPLVVQPMIGRTPVRTTRDFRPGTDTRYTRIIGFGDAVLDPDDADDVAELEKMKISPDWDPGEPPVLTGFRIYADRDVRVETNAGEILVALAPEAAPNTAWNFRHLAEHGFYNDTMFHRVVHFDRTGRRFVIQGGDPSGTGEGSAGWDLPMENSTLPHDLGVISMARADHPDSAGSQFFFCLSREGTARLDGQYCAFGYAVDGAETIAKTADVEIEDVAAGKPTAPPVITRMTLVPAPPQDPGIARSDRRISEWWTPAVEDTSDERRTR